MPSVTNTIIISIFEIFIIFSAGFLAKRLRFLDGDDLKKLSKITVHILFPFLAISVIAKDMDTAKLFELWSLPVIGFLFMAIGALLGFPLAKGLKKNDESLRKTFLHLCAINNFGFMPIIIITNLWGKEHLTNLFLLNIGSYIGYWTIGIAVLGETDLKKQFRNILSPSFLSILFAVVLNVSGVADLLPDFFYKASDRLGSASITMMLFIVGASMQPLPITKEVYNISYAILVRNIMIPIVYILLLCLVDLPTEVKQLSFILALMPSAFSSTVITQIYGGDTIFSVQVAITSTLFSILTIPIGLGILNHLGYITSTT